MSEFKTGVSKVVLTLKDGSELEFDSSEGGWFRVQDIAQSDGSTVPSRWPVHSVLSVGMRLAESSDSFVKRSELPKSNPDAPKEVTE